MTRVLVEVGLLEEAMFQLGMGAAACGSGAMLRAGEALRAAASSPVVEAGHCQRCEWLTKCGNYGLDGGDHCPGIPSASKQGDEPVACDTHHEPLTLCDRCADDLRVVEAALRYRPAAARKHTCTAGCGRDGHIASTPPAQEPVSGPEGVYGHGVVEKPPPAQEPERPVGTVFVHHTNDGPIDGAEWNNKAFDGLPDGEYAVYLSPPKPPLADGVHCPKCPDGHWMEEEAGDCPGIPFASKQGDEPVARWLRGRASKWRAEHEIGPITSPDGVAGDLALREAAAAYRKEFGR